jgi:hypothetical protein
MKNLSGFLAVIIILVSCSPSEPLIEETVPDVAEEIVSPAPAWYQSEVQSSVDSLAFYGYSMASSQDSTYAAALALETAVNNVRFEIDRFAEQVRRILADTPDASGYETPAFIIKLRNAVREMDLTGVEIDMETDHSDEGIYYIYARAIFEIEAATQKLAYKLDDIVFIDQIFNQK